MLKINCCSIWCSNFPFYPFRAGSKGIKLAKQNTSFHEYMTTAWCRTHPAGIHPFQHSYKTRPADQSADLEPRPCRVLFRISLLYQNNIVSGFFLFFFFIKKNIAWVDWPICESTRPTQYQALSGLSLGLGLITMILYGILKGVNM